MPLAMLTAVRCDMCGDTRQRKDMSPFNGICNQCFVEHYALCTDCGRLLSDTPQAHAHLSSCRTVNSGSGPPRCDNCVSQEEGYNRWRPTPLTVSIATYRRIRSKRKYGVEIETSECYGYESLNGDTNFGCKVDCSIAGREFDSPILYGDEGFAEIEELLAFGEGLLWEANGDCGCHTHYDMRDESEEELYRVAYAYAKTYNFWKRCVSLERRNNSYCHAPCYNIYDFRRAVDHGYSFVDFCENQERYDYVNIGAYFTHRTFEVRLLEGTVDAKTVCNWVSIHCRFIDYVKALSFDEIDNLFSGTIMAVLHKVTDIIGEVELSDWLRERIRRFNQALYEVRGLCRLPV